MFKIQKQRKKHSWKPQATRFVSQTTKHKKIVICVKYSINTVTPANVQNAWIPRNDDLAPMKKATQSVRDVIVIDGPA